MLITYFSNFFFIWETKKEIQKNQIGILWKNFQWQDFRSNSNFAAYLFVLFTFLDEISRKFVANRYIIMIKKK